MENDWAIISSSVGFYIVPVVYDMYIYIDSSVTYMRPVLGDCCVCHMVEKYFIIT